jgi:MtrB/PioB family decaheme-associated outer membrane protein
MNAKSQFSFTRNIICLSLVAAYGLAQAEDDLDIAKLTKPESTVSVGAGAVSGDDKDRALLGIYNGLRDNRGYGLLDVSVIRRDDATGTWTTLQGSNLGLDNREIGFAQQKQGDWKYFVDYNEMVRHDPRTINTALQGSGTTTPTVVRLGAPGTGSDVNLELKRKAFGIGGDKWITPYLQFEVSFKNEDKDGARQFGSGFVCTSGAAPGCLGPTATRTGWALLMIPEPVNTNTKQFEAKLNFSGDKLALSSGYYGSFFSNSNGNVTPTVPGTLNNALGNPLPLNTGLQGILGLPIALPPDNQAHQVYLSGNYAFTPTTRGTFKYAYSHATQSDSFLGSGLAGAPGGRSDLSGVVNTTLAQMGLTARPIPKLSLLANVRYEDKKDKTPIDLYNIEGTSTFTNSHISSRKLGGKLEASYQLLSSTRATLGLDYQEVKRELPVSTDTVAGLSGLRSKTTETGYRAEIRQTLMETLSGSLGYVSSRRTGSDWYSLCTSAACVAAGAGYGASVPASTIVGASPNSIFPMTLTDRNRDKWRLSADWSPTDRFSLQLSAEDGKDRYTTDGTKGLQDTGMTLFSLDAIWTMTDKWKLTSYVSHGRQVLHVNHSTGYIADLKNTTDTFGLGLTGTPTERLQVGADLSYTKEKDRYGQSLDPAASATNVAFLAAAGGLPDVAYRLTTLKLFSNYALDKASDIRFFLLHQRAKLNEWTWGNNGVPFVYSDGTTISMNQNQNATFLGVTYIYKFQ